jgi:hypothetical protein
MFVLKPAHKPATMKAGKSKSSGAAAGLIVDVGFLN